ncbi:hypothetical protein [Actinomadura livida]|uniref:Uncharacterized protein n=1 Tax=Actinomadura livida TaxID=79909 RepID=A0A7W7MYT0_9ACTN|nr:MULTISPECIES: hypothetical protein [Actinomadura]MBB4776123.1 hypothetical protein [Actinomadura catellatispora]GGU15341.1 hypothetical protein GCM10010208_45390 [Actinomadura livida]
MNGASCRELAAAVGLDAGAPENAYADGSGVSLDETLGVDAEAAQNIAEIFWRGQMGLTRFAPESTPVLWPEHFDVSISLDKVNYGVSLGDAHIDESYAYAGPWESRRGPFWNVSFAARPMRLLRDDTALFDFFGEAREQAARD